MTLDTYFNILNKLDQFSRKYYTKMLLKGVILFLFLGIAFLFFVLGVEYYLWLSSPGRLALLLLFLCVESYLLYRFIIIPGCYLFRFRKGISNKQASLLIGRYFPEVSDKLYNLLDLAENKDQSELLLASIDQRSKQLGPIPFVKAIDLRDNLKYAKYLLIPVLVFGIIWISGNLNPFLGTYKRVVNYDLAYAPPAPFVFKLVSGSLKVLENETYNLQVITEGDIKPEEVYIHLNGKDYLLQDQDGLYRYTFVPPLQYTRFHFRANKLQSPEFELVALKTPAIHDFSITLDFPGYLNRPREVLKSTGNATFPEGTKVNWGILGKHTRDIHLITKDSTEKFVRQAENFSLDKSVFTDMAYTISTSNENVADFERLEYAFKVIKDAYPSLRVSQVMDSLNPNIAYFSGEATDDYRLKSIEVICYPYDDKEAIQKLEISRPTVNFDQFYYTFPSGLRLVEGKNYDLYFQVTDNDGLRGGKVSRSQVFSLDVLNSDEMKNKELEFQHSILENMDRSLDSFKEQKEILNELNQQQKERNSLSFNDQRQIRDFLRKQEQQEQLMQKFSSQLKENLKKSDSEDPLNKLLQERLERQEIEARKNEKLLKELDKIADKIDKEDLSKRLEELGKKQQNSERGLEQLVELTKRYYVTEKAAQLAKDLEELSRDQDTLARVDGNLDSIAATLQEQYNQTFDELAKELEELKKDNQGLKKPLPLNIDKAKEESVRSDQKEALEELGKAMEKEPSDKGEKEKGIQKAKQKQKAASDKIREMSDDLKQSASASGGGSTITEDAEMLRQILDNLITFSFKQENLYDQLAVSDQDVSHYSKSVRSQQELRKLFEHVDDSLFALSLRRAELSELVNEQITEVYYNIDKSLESIADNQIYQGVSYQQYVLTASNNLADYLASILDNMQESMAQGAGSGSGQEGFQLPDIIKGQGDLKDKMGQAGKSGEKGNSGKQGSEGKGEEGDQGDGEKSGGEDGKGENGDAGKGNGGNQDGQGSAEGDSEESLQELYEIYKEQQLIREQLEKQLEDMIQATDKELARKLIRQMEDFENDLLENGITQRTISKMNTIEHQLLKLENATLKQGEKQERESEVNKGIFANPITTRPELLKESRDDIEILNRQTLPLHQIFQDKVKDYFNKND